MEKNHIGITIAVVTVLVDRTHRKHRIVNIIALHNQKEGIL